MLSIEINFLLYCGRKAARGVLETHTITKFRKKEETCYAVERLGWNCVKLNLLNHQFSAVSAHSRTLR